MSPLKFHKFPFHCLFLILRVHSPRKKKYTDIFPLILFFLWLVDQSTNYPFSQESITACLMSCFLSVLLILTAWQPLRKFYWNSLHLFLIRRCSLALSGLVLGLLSLFLFICCAFCSFVFVPPFFSIWNYSYALSSFLFLFRHVSCLSVCLLLSALRFSLSISVPLPLLPSSSPLFLSHFRFFCNILLSCLFVIWTFSHLTFT